MLFLGCGCRHVEGIEAMARHALPPPDPLDLGEAEVELSEDADVDYDFLSRGELAGCACPPHGPHGPPDPL